MGARFTETTIREQKSTKAHTPTFPSRRNQIKRKIFKIVAVKIGSMVAGFGRKNTETGGFLSSNSTIPTGCNSDASSGSPPIRLLPERDLVSEAVIPGSNAT